MFRNSVHTHTKYIVSLIFRYFVVNRIAVALTLFAYCNFHNNTTWQNGCILVILEIRRPKFIFARKKYQIMLNERPLILHENCSHFLFPALPLVHCRFLSDITLHVNLLSRCIPITNSFYFHKLRSHVRDMIFNLVIAGMQKKTFFDPFLIYQTTTLFFPQCPYAPIAPSPISIAMQFDILPCKMLICV